MTFLPGAMTYPSYLYYGVQGTLHLNPFTTQTSYLDQFDTGHGHTLPPYVHNLLYEPSTYFDPFFYEQPYADHELKSP